MTKTVCLSHSCTQDTAPNMTEVMKVLHDLFGCVESGPHGLHRNARKEGLIVKVSKTWMAKLVLTYDGPRGSVENSA